MSDEPDVPEGEQDAVESAVAEILGDQLVRQAEEFADKARTVGLRNRLPVAIKAKIVLCLATGMSVREAAAETGVSRNTIIDLNANDREFRDLLEQAEQRAVDTIIGDITTTVKVALKELGPTAIAKLKTALSSEDPRVFMPAARLVLTGGGMVERGGGVTVNVNGVESDVGSDSPAQGD